jgi:phosphatidylglycerol:prolipoprotein diacylglycerol transferase
VAVSSLGVFSVLAFLAGLFLIWRRGKEEGLDEETVLDTAFLGLLMGLVVGRAIFIMEHWPDFGSEIGRWIDLRHFGGFSFFGAALGAWVVLFFTSREKKWNFWSVSDLAVFGLIGAQILVRIGQFLDGSYLGIPTELPLGLPFSGAEGKRFPVQLAEIGFLLLVYFWLKRLEKQYRSFVWYQDKRGETRPGFLTLTYGLVYGLFRFALAFFQPASVYWVGLALGQWVSLAAVAVCLGLFFERMGKGEKWLKGIRDRQSRARVRPALGGTAHERLVGHRRPHSGRNHIKAGRDVKT